MANFSMPWVQADFNRKTGRLTRVQRAAYRELLQACFDGGGELPDDDRLMARICDLDVRTFRKHRAVLLSFFYKTVDGWRHSRIDDDLSKISTIKAHRSLAGQKGGLKTAMLWHRMKRN